MRNTAILLLSLTVMVIMSQEDDDRNKAVEAAGTAVVFSLVVDCLPRLLEMLYMTMRRRMRGPMGEI